MLWTIFAGGALGVVFGFVLQRARFCMTGGFRDMYIARNNRMFYAFLIAILIQSVGVLTLIESGYIASPYKDFSVLGAMLGSYVFGIGIILAGGCATGTWYRAGEGLIGSWLALVMYMLSAAMMKYGALQPLQKSILQYGRVNDNLAAALGIFVGSYIAAKGSREFRWRLPDTKTLANSTVGGLLMGVGASLAGGCTIGNGLTATAVMSSKGWIALAFTLLGVWTAAHFIFVRPVRRAALQAAV